MKLAGTVLTALACALILSGCVSASAYPDGSGNVEGERQRILDLTWQRLELTGVERPSPEVTPIGNDEDWYNAYFQCSSQVVGTSSLSLEFGADVGYGFEAGEEYDDATLLGLYACAAALPLQSFGALTMRSPEQIEYLYEYHKTWSIPCFASRGITIDDAPTRAEFIDLAGQWDPYASVARDNPEATSDLYLHCGIDPATQLQIDASAPDVDEAG